MLSLSETLLVVIVVGVITSASAQIPIGQCNKINSCSCVYDDGTIVNLDPLDRTDGRPNFSNVTDQRNDLYSWNPCTPFTYLDGTTDCVNVSVCMIRKGIPKELVYSLGKPDSANFMVDANGTLKLTYTSDLEDFKRVAEITLQCMSTSKFDFFVSEGEQDINNNTIIYKLLLASKYACAYGPNVKPAEKVSHLNGGTIFAIVLACIVAAYIIFGVAYQGLVKHESGIRLCPHHEFWCCFLTSGNDKKPSDETQQPITKQQPSATYEAL